MWTKYAVTWHGLNSLCGSVPADPEIVKKWLETRLDERVKAPGARSIDEINEEVLASIARGEEFDEKSCNVLVFQRYKNACAQRASTIKAHLKDCARVLSNQYIGRIQGERAFSTRVVNGVYPNPSVYWVPILRPDGSPVVTHDAERDQPIHVRSASGTMNALKRFEMIEPWRMDFELWVLTAKGDKPSVNREDLETLMTYGGVHGYAGERGNGEGKYTFIITEVKGHGRTHKA